MKKSLLKLGLLIISISFICSYVVSENGYYEYTISKQTTITNDKIKEFDLAVQNGENISDWEYFSNERVDYTNRFSNLVYNISDGGNKLFRKYLKKLFKKLGEVVMEDD